MNIAPKVGDRAAIIGKTGSGKTELAKQICRNYPFVVVFDPKRRIRWKGYKRCTTYASLIAEPMQEQILANGEKVPVQRLIYAPDFAELENEDVIGTFFRWVFERQNTTLYVDEVFLACFGKRIPRYYGACIMQGRELDITVISATQRPMDIPQIVLSESEHYFIFRLLMAGDREKIIKILPFKEEQLSRMNEHDFYYGTASGKISGPARLDL
jgi:hypothetical protein